MTTPLSFIHFSEFAEEAAPAAEGLACLSAGTDDAPDPEPALFAEQNTEAEEPAEGSGEHEDDREGIVNPTLLSVLAKNRAGTWFSSQRARHVVWSFFCPSDPSLGWEDRGKAVMVDCLICHAQR